MRALLIAALLFLVGVTLVHAAPYTASCSVSPNPVQAGQPFTVTAVSNRTPFYVNITEPGQNFAWGLGPFDASPALVQWQTAFSGNGSVRVFARNEHNGHILGSSYCAFTVLP